MLQGLAVPAAARGRWRRGRERRGARWVPLHAVHVAPHHPPELGVAHHVRNVAAAPRPRPRRHRHRPPALGHHPDGGRGPARPERGQTGRSARRSQPATAAGRIADAASGTGRHRSRSIGPVARRVRPRLGSGSGLELGLDLVGVLTQTRAGSHRHRLVEGHRRCRVQHLADDGVHLAHQVAG